MSLRVYDLGELVRTLTDEAWPAGRHRLEWDGTTDHGSASPDGVYFLRMEAERFQSQRRVVRLR